METHVDRLQAEENRTRHDERQKERNRLIAGLSTLLGEIRNPQGAAVSAAEVVERARELGFIVDEQFARKNVFDQALAIDAVIRELEVHSSGVVVGHTVESVERLTA